MICIHEQETGESQLGVNVLSGVVRLGVKSMTTGSAWMELALLNEPKDLVLCFVLH